SVRPGLTGLAQLLLPPDTDVESARRKLAHDRAYIENRTPWLDLRLLFGTLGRAAGAHPNRVRRALALPVPHAPRAGAGQPDPARSEPRPATVAELCAGAVDPVPPRGPDE